MSPKLWLLLDTALATFNILLLWSMYGIKAALGGVALFAIGFASAIQIERIRNETL